MQPKSRVKRCRYLILMVTENNRIATMEKQARKSYSQAIKTRYQQSDINSYRITKTNMGPWQKAFALICPGIGRDVGSIVSTLTCHTY